MGCGNEGDRREGRREGEGKGKPESGRERKGREIGRDKSEREGGCAAKSRIKHGARVRVAMSESSCPSHRVRVARIGGGSIDHAQTHMSTREAIGRGERATRERGRGGEREERGEKEERRVCVRACVFVGVHPT